MLDKSRTLLTPRPLWVITRYENNRMEVFTTGLELDGGFVGVFSFEEEAEAFLWLLGDDEKKKGWGTVSRRHRESWSGYSLRLVRT